MQEGGGPQIYYVKGWRSEKDFSRDLPPGASWLYHTGEKAAFETSLNVKMRFGDLRELKAHVQRRFCKLEYGVALPEEWDRALTRHAREYDTADGDTPRVEDLKVVVRGGKGAGRWGRERRKR